MDPQNEASKDFRQNLIRYGGDLYPEIIEKAQGCYVWDSTGKKILDFTSGQMCATVGHSHPNIVAAIKNGCDSALHLFSGMIPRSVVRLAAALAKIVPKPLRKSLLLNTGSESNEAAIKMAKLAAGRSGAWSRCGSGLQRQLRHPPSHQRRLRETWKTGGFRRCDPLRRPDLRL